MKTMDIKTITDKSCSEAIARFCFEWKLTEWKRPNTIYKTLKQLTRERDQIVSARSVVKNQLHAETSEAYPVKSTIKRCNELIKFLNKQEAHIKLELGVVKDKEIKDKISKMTTIPGVGIRTATIVLVETKGFELIKNNKQLTSYAGLDVKEKQSGTSVRGKNPGYQKREIEASEKPCISQHYLQLNTLRAIKRSTLGWCLKM